MKSIAVRPDQLWVTPELERSQTEKQFEDRLKASIDQIGLVEPIKVASTGERRYLIVDGVLRWRAIMAIREADASRFTTVPAYVVNHDHRFEVRYQTDIYQDLLPSQLAALVEHLHQNDHIQKTQIAAYIGVSAPTLRNYTGLWRLIQRGELFARVVDLMDAGVLPASNPYAWLRLTDEGIRTAIEVHLAIDGEPAEAWMEQQMDEAAAGRPRRLSLRTVEAITGGLPAHCYGADVEVRSKKRQLGLRRSKQQTLEGTTVDTTAAATRNLRAVARRTSDPVLKIAAESLQAVLT
jgi:hypothetical protein